MRTGRFIIALACCGLVVVGCGSDDSGELRDPAPRTLKAGGKAEGDLDYFRHIPIDVHCGSEIDFNKIGQATASDGTLVNVGKFEGMGLKSSHSFSFAGKAGYRFRFALEYPTAPEYPRLGAYVYVYDAETGELLTERLAHQAYRGATAVLDSAFSHKYIVAIQSARRDAKIDYKLTVGCERFPAIHTPLAVEPQGRMVVKLHNHKATDIYANECSTFFWEKYTQGDNANIPAKWVADRPATYCYHFGYEPADGNMFTTTAPAMTPQDDDDTEHGAPVGMIWQGGNRRLAPDTALEQVVFAPAEPGTYRLVSTFASSCSDNFFLQCQGWKTAASAQITVKAPADNCKMVTDGMIGGSGRCVHPTTGENVERSCCEKTCDSIQTGYTAAVQEGRRCPVNGSATCGQMVQSSLGGCRPSCSIYINSGKDALDTLKVEYSERGCHILDWNRMCPMYAAFDAALTAPEVPNLDTGVCVTEYGQFPWLNPSPTPLEPGVIEDASETALTMAESNDPNAASMIWMPCREPIGAACKAPCAPVMCEMYCVNGFATDPATGCEVCRCN